MSDSGSDCRPAFHLAFPVTDLEQARAFYTGVLGCREGRSDDCWVDFDFYGHQIVAHRVESSAAVGIRGSNPVDGEDVPVPHFGLVLDWQAWEVLAGRLQTASVRFIIEPGVRFAGTPGEQATLFLLDPFGNALEFKAMRRPENLFAK